MRRTFLASAIVLLLVSLAARAEPITYTESLTGSGSLGGVSFTNSLVTFTGTGDTTNVISSSPGVYQNFLTLQGTVAGLGGFTLVAPTDVFSNTNLGGAGISGPGTVDIVDTSNAEFDVYDLTSAIAVTGSPYIDTIFQFATTDGYFDLTGGGDSTFQATVGVAVSPEPSSFLLLATGLLGGAGVLCRRFS